MLARSLDVMVDQFKDIGDAAGRVVAQRNLDKDQRLSGMRGWKKQKQRRSSGKARAQCIP